MATRRSCPSEEEEDGDGNDKKYPNSGGSQRKSKTDGRGHSENTSPMQDDVFSWPGPKTISLRRTSQGFGFTLRHFIVYPPESVVHTSVKDEENGNKGGRPKGKLEPMDTIFVKQVKEGGPANNAGLCTGDRIVKVNGESIIGKTYSQVIALIQNSDSVLELCVMPKDEDILQLAYSQDAYLKGNDPYTGNAHYIPEPPPVCYPRMTATSSSMALPMEVSPPELSRGKQQLNRPVRTISTSDRGYRAELQVPPSPTDIPKTNTAVCVCNETVRTIVVPSEKFADLVPSRINHASPAHRTEEIRYGLTDHNVGKLRPRTTSSLTMPTNTIVQQVTSGRTKDTTTTTSTANANKPVSYGAYKDDTSSRSISQTTDSPVITNHYTSPTSLAAHQNIDWRNYKTYKEYTENRRLHMYGSRTIQERLDSLRAAVQNTTEYQQTMPTRTISQVRRRSTSHDRAYQTTPIRCRSVSQERLGEPVVMKDWPRSASQDALTSPVIASQNHRARSCDYLGKQAEDPQGLTTDIGTLCKHDPDADRLQRIYNRATGFSELDNKLGVHDGFRQPVRQVGQPGCHTSIGGTTRPQNIIFSPSVHSTDIIKTRSSIRSSTHSSPAPRVRKVTMDTTPVQFCRDHQSAYAGQQPLAPQEKSCLAVSFQTALPSSSLSTSVSNGAAVILPPTQTMGIGAIKVQRTVNHKSCGQHSSPRTRAESVPEHSAEVASSLRSASCSEPSSGQPIAQPGRPVISPTTSSIASVRQKSKDSEKAKSENKPQENQLKLDEEIWLEQNQRGSGQKDQKASDRKETVILREKTSLGRLTPQPLRHKSYILAITSPDTVTDPTCWLPNDGVREVNLKRIGQHRKTSISSPQDDSLASIPFIDEPTSPSVDQESAHIPASAVISAGVSEILTITTVPPSPITPSPHIRRQLSHDQDTIRTSTPDSQPTGKTERSKSYDEGLDNYREERSKSIKHVPSLKGLKKAADSLKLSDDIIPRRDSSSDGFSDASKDGWLQFRQLVTEKGKRVGGSIRPWKQMYSVLRGHTLYLHKDKKDKTSHASCQFEEEQPISIKACLIDISYSETKRKHVFRLTTSECEYLFQAEDREDMLGWIKAIQENSNLDDQDTGVTSRDLISRKIKEYSTMMSSSGSKTEASPKTPRQSLSIRQTFLGTKNDPKSPHSPKQEFERKLINDTSPPKDKGTWRRGIPSIMRKTFEKKPCPGITFGVRLDDCPPAHNNKFVPLIVEVCCNLVEERGLDYTGIYRVPGNNAAISNLQEELNKATTDIDILDDKWRDLNVISSLLKSFFRKLPEPLFTNDKYADFIDANRKEDSVDRLRTLKKLIRDLPDHHYETLKFLSAHLKTVAENSEKNKMEPRNLAIVFGPTLVRTSEDNMTHMVTHMPDQYKIVETLIQHYDWFFTEEGDEDATTPIQEESTVDTQPVPNIDHLLTNIGRTGTTPGDVSDSTTSDSAKSKGSRGSGKDQYGRDLLVSSILAAASRKRKKKDIKPLQSSSDDELESGFSRKGQSSHSHGSPTKELAIKREPENEINSSEPKGTRVNKGSEQQEKEMPGGKRYTSSVTMVEKKGMGIPPSAEEGKRQPEQTPSPHCQKPTDSPKISYRRSSQLIASTIPTCPVEVSVSKVNSKTNKMASDTGTTITNESQVSLQQTNTNKWKPSEIRNIETGAADVNSITSDYSTISSTAYLAAMDSHTLNAEVRSVAESKGDEADDERSELVSEEHHIETDSDSDFSVFAASYTPEKGACATKQETGTYNRRSSEGSDMTGTEGSSTPRLDSQRMFSSRKLIECDTLSKKKSIRLKKDLETAMEQNESNRGSKLVDVMKKGKSTSSLASCTKNEPEKVEPPWKLKITDRLKLRLKTSADDMFGIGVNKASSGDISKKKNIRRRHTMGGHRDFAELSVLNDWRAQEQEQNSQNNAGSGSREYQLSAVDRLKPKCQSQDLSITEWLARERLRSSTPDLHPEKVPESRSVDINLGKGAHPKVRASCGEEAGSSQLSRPSPSASPSPVSLSGQVNGDGHQSKSKSNFSSVADAHPHKLSSNQVVKSRFYQYL